MMHFLLNPQHALEGDHYVYRKVVELKPPMTALKRKIESLQDSHISGEITSLEMGTSLRKVMAHLKSFEGLLNDLVDLTCSSDEEIFELEIESTNLCILAAQVMDEILQTALRGQSNLMLYCPHPIIGEWDSYRIKQALSQLILNAIDHAPGSIIQVRLSIKESKACIEVCDQGPGIPLDKQIQIFERFVKLDENHDGLGVGLWIVKKIVERHSGSINLLSDSKSGSIFKIELPLKELPH